VEVGDTQTVTLEVNPSDGTTTATLTVIAPDGTTSTPGLIVSADRSTWEARVVYDAPGTWTLRWEVTGTGAGVQTTQVHVNPALPVTRRTYATTQDYAAYLGVAPPPGIDLLLARASLLVDEALLSAVYPVGEDGMPADPAVAAALRDATIEQAAYWVATGEDGSGATAEYANVSIGSVSLGRAQTGAGGGGSGAVRPLAPAAALILSRAGLLGHAPQVI